MKEHKVIIGEFEDRLCAEVAKRDLSTAGIKANILKENNREYLSLLNQCDGVQLMVPHTQLEEARKVLSTKFM